VYGEAGCWSVFRHGTSWPQVLLSTNVVQLQMSGNSVHGFAHLITRQTTSVVWGTCVLHWPYLNTLQHVDRLEQEPFAHEQPCGQCIPGLRLQSM